MLHLKMWWESQYCFKYEIALSYLRKFDWNLDKICTVYILYNYNNLLLIQI